MIKGRIRNAKGVSLISLVIAIAVLVILTNVIIYNVKDNLKVGKLKEMQNDITNLRDKISSYYAQNGTIPASIKYTNIDHIREAGVISETADTGDFLVIELSALENLTLNYGEDYEKVKSLGSLTDNEAKTYTDLYIINETSHNIFYVAGITLDKETFYTDYTSDDVDLKAVDLKYVEGVKIPEGFYYVGGTKDTGIVISDVQGDDLDNNAKGNQFVWVPVENINDFHMIEGYENGSLQNILSDSIEPYASGYATEVAEYNTMKLSVKENHGFYIGRFETGKVDNQVVVQKNVPVYNNVNWGSSMTDETGGAVELAKNFINDKSYKNSVTSTLCYGVQWDATMQFFDSNYLTGNCKEDSYVKDSTGKGNYSNSIIKTGSNDDYAIKNIYDMAGNLSEWTMESVVGNESGRVYRGRDSINANSDETGFANPCSYRNMDDLTEIQPYTRMGFRVALYLNNQEKWSAVYDTTAKYIDKNGDVAYIPGGFQVSEKVGENTIQDGLVIQDEDGNQFVWIPVENEIAYERNTSYEVTGISACTYDDTDYLPDGVNKTEEELVRDVGGFYIARYEAGKETVDGVDALVSKKGATIWTNRSYQNAKLTSKTFASNNNSIRSSQVSGIQWDMTMAFISRQERVDGTYQTYDVTKSSSTRHKGSSIGVEVAGNNEADKVCNIYDLEGNAQEYVVELNDYEVENSTTYRGGDYSSSKSASYRFYGSGGPAYSNRSFRFVLYVMKD